jgi:hypothetical protein
MAVERIWISSARDSVPSCSGEKSRLVRNLGSGFLPAGFLKHRVLVQRPSAEVRMTKWTFMSEDFDFRGLDVPGIYQSSTVMMMGLPLAIHKISLRMLPNRLRRHSCDAID